MSVGVRVAFVLIAYQHFEQLILCGAAGGNTFVGGQSLLANHGHMWMAFHGLKVGQYLVHQHVRSWTLGPPRTTGICTGTIAMAAAHTSSFDHGTCILPGFQYKSFNFGDEMSDAKRVNRDMRQNHAMSELFVFARGNNQVCFSSD